MPTAACLQFVQLKSEIAVEAEDLLGLGRFVQAGGKEFWLRDELALAERRERNDLTRSRGLVGRGAAR